MRLTFFHDHRFVTFDGSYYSNGAFPHLAWKRYFEIATELSVCARLSLSTSKVGLAECCKDGEKNPNFSLISTNRVPILFSGAAHRHIKLEVSHSDVIVARLPSEIGLRAIKYAKQLNKPYAIEVVGCSWDALWNRGSWIGRCYAPIAFLRMRSAIKHSEQILYVTHSFLQSRYPKNNDAFAVNASNIELLEAPVASKRCNNDIFSIGLIGNYSTNYKGIDVAMKAVQLLRKRGINLCLRILGAGDDQKYRSIAEKLGILESVHFDGTRKFGRSVYEWIDGLDAYVQPSRQEGLPRALIEAMSRGKICVGSNCGGISELLLSNRIHKVGCHISLQNKLLDILSLDQTQKLQEQNRNLEFAKKNFSQAVIHEKRSKFYNYLKVRSRK